MVMCTMRDGTLTRPMAMRHPGIFLSHPGTVMSPSYHWAPITVSIESAIKSRDCGNSKYVSHPTLHKR